MNLINIRKTCNKCGRESKEVFCDSCFVKVFEKRIRKHLQRQLPFKTLKNITVTDRICEYLIKKIITAPIKITYQPLSNTIKTKISKTNLIIVASTTDDAVESLLGYYFTGKQIKSKYNLKTKSNLFPLLEPVTNEELKRFCQLKKLPYLKKQSDIGRLLSQLEAKYPGTKHALYSTLQELRKGSGKNLSGFSAGSAFQ
ncbi:hypothetical protein HYY69_08465 [Candidatus Woesearchaeota archaeon]|nr:hypothetical protein [Candidatus Woesearchaeota archaeon]